MISEPPVSAIRVASAEDQLLLATLPPSKGQTRLALGIAVALLVVFVATVPFANSQLPQVDAFIPILETAIAINNFIICALLFAQFFVVGRRALLVLAIGYLFMALIVVPHMLTFPGVFSPSGLLGAGASSAAWLVNFWWFGRALAVIAYVLLRDMDGATKISDRSPIMVIVWSATATIAIVCVLTWIATAGASLLPSLMRDSADYRDTSDPVFGLTLSLTAFALALLWLRQRSVLDLWLQVLCFVWMLEIMMTSFLIGTRFTVGWYSGKVFGLVATFSVLVVLLSEKTALYTNLARLVIRQRGAREARQIGMDAMAASIAHEIKQPLASMVTSGHAALNWLDRDKPDLDKARASIERMINASNRANEVIDGIRSMFKRDVHGRASLNINDLVSEVLTMAGVDLQSQRVSVSTELREGLPQLLADRGQLQQVFLNLVVNAIEAMGPVTDRARMLRIRTDLIQESSTILITVEDSGIGIDGESKSRIFEPFFTTKSEGTGIGLAVCWAIIEAHGGSLHASDNNPRGTIFHVALPAGGVIDMNDR